MFKVIQFTIRDYKNHIFYSFYQKLSLHNPIISKNIFINNHKKENLINYCQKDFLPTWANIKKQIIIFMKYDI